MSRPLYENSNSLKEEVKFFRDLRRVDEYKGYRFQKLPLSYRLECAIEDIPSGAVIGFCEFKRRSNRREYYPTVLLSLHKYMSLRDYGEFGQSFLIVRWSDVDGIHHVNAHESSVSDYKIAWGGRQDRNDWQDIEPTIHIPINDFEIVDTERRSLSEQEEAELEATFRSGKGWKVG